MREPKLAIAMPVNSQLFCLLPAGILNHVMSYYFKIFASVWFITLSLKRPARGEFNKVYHYHHHHFLLKANPCK